MIARGTTSAEDESKAEMTLSAPDPSTASKRCGNVGQVAIAQIREVLGLILDGPS